MNGKYCAGIVIRNYKILLLKRSSNEDEPHKWCPINGGIEGGETPEKAVIREAKEETGLDFKIINKLPVHAFKNDNTFVFLGLCEGEVKVNPEEVEDYGWFSYNDAMSLNYAYGYEHLIRELFERKLIQ